MEGKCPKSGCCCCCCCCSLLFMTVSKSTVGSVCCVVTANREPLYWTTTHTHTQADSHTGTVRLVQTATDGSPVKNVAEISAQRRAATEPSAAWRRPGSDGELRGHSPPRRVLHRLHHLHGDGGQRQAENYRRFGRAEFSDHVKLALCEGIFSNVATTASEWNVCVCVCVFG